MLIISTLAVTYHSWADTIMYKYQGCILAYLKIDEYNVEITQQKTTLNHEKINIPTEISHNDTTYYVIGIADNAFSGNKQIKKFTFDPACDMQYIGEGAFSGCQNLTNIELPSTITEIKPYTFAYCGLKFIEIHNLITQIGERAFFNCKNLKTIVMGENVEKIGNYAFARCSSLTSFTIPEKTKHLGYEILQSSNKLDTIFFNAINCETSGAYYDNRIDRTIGAFEYNNSIKEIIFGDRVERIPEYLLYNCHSIDSIYFPKSITQIDRFALHNTEWFDGAKSDMLYVNNILYAYKGNKDSIFAEQFKENITTIENHCFANNQKLKYINLPSNILYIRNSAFENCTNLTKINLPYDLEFIGDYAFRNCKNLTNIKLNNLLEHIGKYSFSNCSNIENIFLPHSLKSMSEAVFYNCANLQRANIPDSIKYVPAGSFSKCPKLEKVTLHNKITAIEEYAFAGCSRLDSITIPWTCASIGSRAFSHCHSLSKIDLKAKSLRIDPLAFYNCENIYYIDLLCVYQIGRKAFANCTNLSYISLGKELKTISNYAFENCSSLFKVVIPQSVTKIGKSAFANCSYLSTVEIDNATTTIEDYAFSNCHLLTNVSLGYNTTKIGIGAFRNCHNLTKIEIKYPIKKINMNCFANCENLHTIELPQSIERFEEKAFYNCKSLTNITIPNTTNFIGERAFFGCSELSSIVIPADVNTIKPEAFFECFKLTNIQFDAENCHTNNPVFAYTHTPTTLNIGNTVQIIDDYIFYGMNLTNIEIPASISSIEKMAFANSTHLEKINILSQNELKIDNTAFNNTAWIKKQSDDIIYVNTIALKYIGKEQPQELTFQEGTTAIASNFMTNNDKLKTINLPSSLQTIGANAFSGCSNITNINFPRNINSIYEEAFINCSNLKYINIPASISKICDSAFENCTQIDSINLNNAYCSIGNATFRNCNKMTKALIGDNITTIGDMAFAFCSSLQFINSNNSVILPENIETINTATFFNCKKLKGKIIIPRNVTSINDQAFENCSAIHSIELSAKLQQISISAFNKNNNFTRFLDSSNKYFSTYNGILYSNNMNILYHCPQGYYGTCVVNSKTKIINNYAFNSCTKIYHVILNHIEKINDYAFNGCTKLKKISLGKEIDSFNHKAFEGCQNLEYISIKKENQHLKSLDGIVYSADMKTLIYCPRAKQGKIKIPKSVQHIADYAFTGCNQITQIITRKNIKSIGKDAFTDTNLQIK